MRALMQQELDGNAGLLIGLVHEVEFLRAHVRVVQTVHDQRRALDLVGVERVVARCPVLAVVAVERVLVGAQLVEVAAVLVGDGAVVRVVEVAAGAVEGQIVAVGDAGGAGALGVGVLIPARDARDGDDGLQTGDAGGGQTELGGARVGAAGHTDLAGGPVSGDGDVAGLVAVGHAVAVQPLDDALEGVDLKVGAAGLKALGALGAETAALHDRIAADEIVVIPGQILVDVHSLIGVVVVPVVGVRVLHHGGGGGAAFGRARLGLAVELGDIILAVHIRSAAGAAGDVGTSLIDRGDLHAVQNLVRELNERLDEIELAVVVGVVVRLDVNAETHHAAVAVGLGGVGHLEDGLRQTVNEERLFVLGVHRVIERLHVLEHGLELGDGAGLLGLIVHTLGQTDALGHEVVVIREAAQLGFLQTGVQEQERRDVLLDDGSVVFGLLGGILSGGLVALLHDYGCALGKRLLAVFQLRCDGFQLAAREHLRALFHRDRGEDERNEHDEHEQQRQSSFLHSQFSFQDSGPSIRADSGCRLRFRS